MKKVVAFDLDGTLAPSKSPLPDEMSDALGRLLEKYEVCVISGGKFGQFETQLIGNLKVREHLLARLHIMPTCGTRYYRYEDIQNEWKMLYAEDFSDAEKEKIIAALKEGIVYCGYDKEKTWGDQIEDRGSQITFSALGQEAPVEAKEAWDPRKKRKRNYATLLRRKFLNLK